MPIKHLEQGLANRKHRWRDLPGTDVGASHAGGRKRAQADGGTCGVLGPFVQCLSVGPLLGQTAPCRQV